MFSKGWKCFCCPQMPKTHRRSLVAPIVQAQVRPEPPATAPQQQQRRSQMHLPVDRPKKKSDISMYINWTNFFE